MAEPLRISVVIATYNREKYIGKALMGLLNQDLALSAFVAFLGKKKQALAFDAID